MLYTCGHKIPDSDSIVSAIAMAYLKNKLNIEAKAVRQGEINAETKFILDKFNLEKPELKTSFASCDIYLTDHNNYPEAPDDLKEANLIGIVDHHKLGGLITGSPLECWIRPVGCTNTIVKEMFDYYGIEIPKDIAGAMMCAILSDTVIFKSPTCTKIDTKITKELAKIAGIEDFKSLGLEMFNIKSNVEGASCRDLVMRDYKKFNMGSYSIAVGQLEVVDLSIFDNIKNDLKSDINKLRKEENLDAVLLLLTDIMKVGSQVLVSSDDNEPIQKAFGKSINDDEFWLKGCLSRKKQVIPLLEKVYS